MTLPLAERGIDWQAGYEECARDRHAFVKELRLLNENLSSVQARCTELLLENRELRRWYAENVMGSSRMHSLIGALLLRLDEARTKHPEGANFENLAEELGEVARAMRREGPERVREELLDVAVVALRLYLDETPDRFT